MLKLYRYINGKIWAAKYYLRFLSRVLPYYLSPSERGQRSKPNCLLITAGLGSGYIIQLAWLLDKYYNVYLQINRRNFQAFPVKEDNIHLSNVPFLHVNPYITLKRKISLIVREPSSRTIRANPHEVFLNFDYFAEDKTGYSIPLGLSPHQVVHYDEACHLKRLSTKKIKILFAGSVDKSWYADPIFNDVFKILNRYQIFNALVEKAYSKNSYKVARSFAEINEFWAKNEVIDFAILEHSTERTNTVARTHWLDLMSKTDFFVAGPGVIMPFCHNIFEALSVGTIPITEYGRFFQPVLDTNCSLKFNNISDFHTAINLALTMNEREKEDLRQRSIEYYDNHLSRKAVSEKIISEIKTGNRQLYMVPEHESIKLLREKLRRTTV